jgi:hypothetical protein
MSTVFERFARGHGGALSLPAGGGLETLVGQCKGQAEHRIRVQCPDPEAVRIEIGIINDGSFNAFAAKAEGVDLIGINVGTIFILRDLFDSMLSRPDILVQIGNIHAETARPSIYDPETHTLNLKILSHHRLFEPQDPERSKYSSTLFTIAFYFIFQHEFGHIFGGHVDWLMKTTGLPTLPELGAISATGLTGLDLQTLELDADCFGIQDVAMRVFRYNSAASPAFPDVTAIGPKRDGMFALYFALYAVFRIFATRPTGQLSEILKDDHPPAIFRQRFVWGKILELLQRFDIMSVEDFEKISIEATLECERAFAVMTGRPVDPNLHTKETWDASGKLVSMILANWKVLRPELDELKRGGVLAAVQA